jgi:outer membrane lipoprotein carrier protein
MDMGKQSSPAATAGGWARAMLGGVPVAFALTLALALAGVTPSAMAAEKGGKGRGHAKAEKADKADKAEKGAKTGRAQLENFLHGSRTLRAVFQQVLSDEKGKILERSEGFVYLSRPGRFRWDYVRPFQQSVVGDGKAIWIHDQDLQQVTVRSLAGGLGSTPAALLGEDVDIDKEFTVTEEGMKEHLTWLRLVPRAAENQYREIHLGFDKKGLRAMNLSDNLGQNTTLAFTAEQQDIVLDPNLFLFIPPPGTDVLDQREGAKSGKSDPADAPPAAAPPPQR